MLKSNSWKPTVVQKLHPRAAEKVENHSHSKPQDSKSWGQRIESEENKARNKDCRSSSLHRRQCTRKKTSLQLSGSSAGHELPAHGLPWELTYSTRQLQTLLELTSKVFVQLQRGSGRRCSNCWTEKRFKSVCSRADWQGGMDSVWKTCKERDYFQQQGALKSHRIKSFPRSH